MLWIARNSNRDTPGLAFSMKTVRTSRLVNNQGRSDKAYEVDLCDVSSAGAADQFVVNFRYGRSGTALHEGTKTPSPVSQSDAIKIFDSLVVAKLNKGYQDNSSVIALAGLQQDSQAYPDRNQPTHHASQSKRFQGAVNRVKIGLADIASGQLDEKTAGRLVWRAGELGAAEFCAPMLRLLDSNLDSNNEMLEYSLIWALGRCGDENTAQTLTPLIRSASTDKARRVATWATIRLSGEAQANAVFDSVAGELPGRLYALANSTDRSLLQQTLDVYFDTEHQDCNNALHQLYLLSFKYPVLRFTLLRVLEKLSPKPNVFRGMRQVYKAAEFFKDAQVFGLINLRLDVTRSFYTPPTYGDYTFVPAIHTAVRVSQEMVKPDSRIAYSSNTRRYLRARTWRSLKRMGELDLADYIEMAMGILLCIRPNHQQEPRQIVQTYWNGGSRQIDYDEYGHLNALINIAFGAGTRYKISGNAQTWQVNPDYTDADEREERFAHLWDKHPEALLQLLLNSEIGPVHEFASKAMMQQTGFFEQITDDQLFALLTKPFVKTKALAFSIAKSRYHSRNPNFKLVYFLLDSEYQPAVEQAREWVNEQPRTFASSLEFVSWVVTADTQETRHWCRTLVELAENDNGKALADELIQWLLELDEEEIDQAQVSDVEWVLLNPLKRHSATLAFDPILKLLAHPAPAVQVVAGRLLLNHEKPAEQIPPAVFTRLLESPVAEVRGVGVELFAQLPTEAIVQQPELVESFCVAPEAEVRAGIRPAIAKLAKDHQTFSEALMRKLIDRLFRKETAEGVHADLVSMLTTELAEVTATCEKSLNWRLLSARSPGAQSLGVWLLQSREQNDFTVRQWAAIAHNDHLVCREWAWQCYRDNVDRVVEHASDA